MFCWSPEEYVSLLYGLNILQLSGQPHDPDALNIGRGVITLGTTTRPMNGYGSSHWASDTVTINYSIVPDLFGCVLSERPFIGPSSTFST